MELMGLFEKFNHFVAFVAEESCSSVAADRGCCTLAEAAFVVLVDLVAAGSSSSSVVARKDEQLENKDQQEKG